MANDTAASSYEPREKYIWRVLLLHMKSQTNRKINTENNILHS